MQHIWEGLILSKPFFCLIILVLASFPVAINSSFIAMAVASIYYNGYGVAEDHAASARWLSKAARQGESRAAYILGNRYYQGDGVPANRATSVYWWLRAAEMGNADAQAMLGDAYCLGIGVSPDGREAHRLWHLAAQQGSKHAIEMDDGNGCNALGRHVHTRH
jgi:TPR repeat protein